MQQYLELELLILFASAILLIGGIIVYKDRSNARKRKALAENYHVQKVTSTRKPQRKLNPAERQRLARRRAQQQMTRQRA